MDKPTTWRALRSRGSLAALLATASLFLLSACDPISLTMMGVGAGAGVGHELGGIVYKTFTASEPQVKKACFAALKRMAIKVAGVEKIEGGERIKAIAGDRNIEIELDSLTPNTTRMRAVARKDGGVIVDSATAVEIITQTERVLGANG